MEDIMSIFSNKTNIAEQTTESLFPGFPGRYREDPMGFGYVWRPEEKIKVEIDGKYHTLESVSIKVDEVINSRGVTNFYPKAVICSWSDGVLYGSTFYYNRNLHLFGEAHEELDNIINSLKHSLLTEAARFIKLSMANSGKAVLEWNLNK